MSEGLRRRVTDMSAPCYDIMGEKMEKRQDLNVRLRLIEQLKLVMLKL